MRTCIVYKRITHTDKIVWKVFCNSKNLEEKPSEVPKQHNIFSSIKYVLKMSKDFKRFQKTSKDFIREPTSDFKSEQFLNWNYLAKYW